MDAMVAYERQVFECGFKRVAGVDEAGRGPLAGPIVAAAVILNGPVDGVNDSKQLTHTQRKEIYEAIRAGGHCIGVGIVDAATIDRHGIQCANYASMANAVAQLEPPPDFLLVDGFQIKGCAVPQKPLIKGDCLSASIAAASIVAKVVRDGIMTQFDQQYPGYGFAEHKGYCTRDHSAALAKLGPCPIHRRSFAPVAGTCPEGLLFEL
jgi:ribonuclease HII